jgi:hypothetical protein
LGAAGTGEPAAPEVAERIVSMKGGDSMSNSHKYPHTPSRLVAGWWSADRCSACHHPLDLRPDETLGAFVFCDDCLQRSRELTEWDDLGAVD